ncbi:helix-turn-helix domain-containing protein [Actinoplanes missouriensis]|uniref:helix-turn-helix domain-containing protein n=1 Tax=Actinoplanes missouriensis TaxID=1866 RepID=UPI003F4CFB7B
MALLRRVIGAVLRRVRQAQDRTLRDVAEAAGVSLPYLSEVERGTKEPSSEVLAAICRALGLSLPDLLDEARKELLRGAPAPRAGLSGPVPRAAVVAPAPRSRFVTHRSAGSAGPTCSAGVSRKPGAGLRSAARLRCVRFSDVYAVTC